MEAVLPGAFSFRYSIPVSLVEGLPKPGKSLLSLPKTCVLPLLNQQDEQPPLAEMKLAWNREGLGIAVEIQRPPGQPWNCSAKTPATSDGVQVWLDTRDTRNIHRASRFCHHFCFLPAGGGGQGDQPLAVQLPLARAREATPLCDPAVISLKLTPGNGSDLLEVWLPREAMNAYVPDSSPRLGFYYLVRQGEREQYLTVGPEFPFAYDPSLWVSLDLVK